LIFRGLNFESNEELGQVSPDSERAVSGWKLTPVNGKISQDSVQYPLEGCKCLGGHFKFLISIHSPDFLFFMTGNLE
jgi:hypothetical protein